MIVIQLSYYKLNEKTTVKNKGEIVSIVLAVAVFAAVGAFLFQKSIERDAFLSSVSDCVVSQAEAQKFPGNPHSQEAWILFYPSCANEQ